MAWWKCPNCGLELSFEEVCQSGGHKHDTELEKAAKRAARTGTRKDLQAYLKMRKNFR